MSQSSVSNRIKCVIQGSLHRSDNAPEPAVSAMSGFSPFLGTVNTRLLKSVAHIKRDLCGFLYHRGWLDHEWRYSVRLVCGVSPCIQILDVLRAQRRRADPSGLSARFQPRRFHIDLVHPVPCVVHSIRGRPAVGVWRSPTSRTVQFNTYL